MVGLHPVSLADGRSFAAIMPDHIVLVAYAAIFHGNAITTHRR